MEEGDEKKDSDEEYWERYAEAYMRCICDEHVDHRMETARTRTHALTRGMRSKDAVERRKAVEELADHLVYEMSSLERAHLRRLAKRLFELTGDDDALVRCHAARGLSVLAGSDLVRTKVPFEEMVWRLSELTKSEDTEVRRHAVSGLISLERHAHIYTNRTSSELVTILLKLSSDTDSQIQGQVVFVLKGICERIGADELELRADIESHLRGLEMDMC